MIFAIHYQNNSSGVEYVNAGDIFEAQESFREGAVWVDNIISIELVDEFGKVEDQ